MITQTNNTNNNTNQLIIESLEDLTNVLESGDIQLFVYLLQHIAQNPEMVLQLPRCSDLDIIAYLLEYLEEFHIPGSRQAIVSALAALAEFTADERIVQYFAKKIGDLSPRELMVILPSLKVYPLELFKKQIYNIVFEEYPKDSIQLERLKLLAIFVQGISSLTVAQKLRVSLVTKEAALFPKSDGLTSDLLFNELNGPFAKALMDLLEVNNKLLGLLLINWQQLTEEVKSWLINQVVVTELRGYEIFIHQVLNSKDETSIKSLLKSLLSKPSLLDSTKLRSSVGNFARQSRLSTQEDIKIYLIKLGYILELHELLTDTNSSARLRIAALESYAANTVVKDRLSTYLDLLLDSNWKLRAKTVSCLVHDIQQNEITWEQCEQLLIDMFNSGNMVARAAVTKIFYDCNKESRLLRLMGR